MRTVRHALPLLALAVSFEIDRAAAQNKELALVAGPNYTGVAGPSLFKSERQLGAQGGLSIRIPRAPSLSLQFELLLAKRRTYGERSPSNLPPLAVGPISDDADLIYLELPVLLRFQRGYGLPRPVRPFFLLGPYAGLLVGCQRDVVEADSTLTRTGCNANLRGATPLPPNTIRATYEEVDFGVLAGIGVEIRRLSLSVRGQHSLRKLVDASAVATSPLDNSKLWSIALSLEYVLRTM